MSTRVQPHGAVGTLRLLVQGYAKVRNEPVISCNRMQRQKRRHIEIELAKDVINDVIPKWMKIRCERTVFGFESAVQPSLASRSWNTFIEEISRVTVHDNFP